MELILAFLGKHLGLIITLFGFAGVGGLLNWILKRFITEKFLDKIGEGIEKVGFGLGVLATVGLSKFKYTKGIWNKVIEPYVVILLKLVAKKLIGGLVKGLESDNPSLIDG